MRNTSLRIIHITLLLAMFAGASLPTPAHAEGWYLGADLVSQRTTLDYTASKETYGTQHIRMKLGYAFNDFFALEARGMSSGNDTATHTGGNKFRWQTGQITSLYARATLPLDFRFGHIDAYGLYGVTSMDTTYSDTVAVTSSTEKVRFYDFGLGVEYKVNQNFYLALEGRLYTGTASYSTYFTTPDSVAVNGRSVSVGTTFRF